MLMCKNPVTTSPTKIHDWTAIHKQKQLWKTSRARLGEFSNTMEQQQKTLRITTQKRRKTTSFCLHHHAPQADIVQCPQETSQLVRIPLTCKGRVGWATSLSEHCPKVLLQLNPPRQADRNKGEKQICSRGSVVVYRDLLCRYIYTAASTNDQVTSEHNYCRSSSDLQLSPQVFMFANASAVSLCTSSCAPACPQPGFHYQPQRECAHREGEHTNIRAPPLFISPGRVLPSVDSPSICAPACFQPDPHHLPPQQCSHPGTDNVATGEHTDTQGPHNCLWDQIRFCLHHWLAPPGERISSPLISAPACPQPDLYHWPPFHCAQAGVEYAATGDYTDSQCLHSCHRYSWSQPC